MDVFPKKNFWEDAYCLFDLIRGADLRKTFISHLSVALKKHGITTFTSPEPSTFDLQSIVKSEMAITVISKSYDDSLEWWVDEMAKIIKCEKVGTLKTVPVFFQVDPSIVLKWLGRTEKRMDATRREKLEMAKIWLDSHITNKSCFNSRDWMDDSELVDEITRFVSDTLISSTSNYQSGLLPPPLKLKLEDFGLSSSPFVLGTSILGSWIPCLPFGTPINPSAYVADRKQELGALVLDEDSTVIGLCGQEGVGKTNLARQVSEEVSSQFQHKFFMNNLSSNIQRRKRSYGSALLLDFASASLKESSFHGSSDDDIKEIITHQKVLFVVDGVDDVKGLKSIIEEARMFGRESRFIVITRERTLLTQCGVKHIYEVECPNNEEAIGFFSEFAFKRTNPLPGYEALSLLAVKVSNRLPLSLKMLGSFLYDKEKSEWVSTLRKLEASHNNYAIEACRYIGAEDYAQRRPMIVDQHIGIDEAKRFPFYRFALK